VGVGMKVHPIVSVEIAKRVNGGAWLHFARVPRMRDATRLIVANRAFHRVRCPRDVVEYQVVKYGV
jgi:hypothetical protein